MFGELPGTDLLAEAAILVPAGTSDPLQRALR